MNPEELVTAIRAKFPRSKLEALDAEGVRGLVDAFGDPPPEYLALLNGLGWGEIGRQRFMLYPGPVPAEEIFSDEPALRGAFLIGDDFGGYHVGFKQLDGAWVVVEFDQASPEDLEVSRSLSDTLACVLSLPG